MRLHEICPLITEECDIWLESIGYYAKPASIRFHGKETGDLFRHSKAVAVELQNMTDMVGLDWQREASPMLVGMLHDVCKCDDYVRDQDGEWTYNRNKTMDGHGDKSVIMLAGHIQLTEEEIFCIRFHMGAYTEKEEWPYYGKAVELYPNVLYTHMADMVASKVKGI